MSRALPLCFLALASGCAANGAANGRASGAGATELFDGRSLAGWEGDARFWRVEDGALVGESTAGVPCAETTYLVWRGGEVRDFVLELEWRFPAGNTGANSGVQFRSAAPSFRDVTGYQADLETGPDWTGGLYEQGGRGVATRRGERVVFDARGEKSVERIADADALLARLVPGDWNRMRITASGPRLSIELDDVLYSETIDLDLAHAARAGALALQLHAGAPMRVEYRNLRLRSLEPASMPPAAPRIEPHVGPRAALQWIWSDDEVRDHQVVWFRRRFELAAEPERAALWVSADNHFDAWLGGQGVATSDDWMHPMRVEVADVLQEGENELLVRAENDLSEAGLVLELSVEFAPDAGEPAFALTSDASFEACLEPVGLAEAARGAWLAAAPWEDARELGAFGVAPWGRLGDDIVDDGVAPEAASIRVPPGFAVERLYSVPLARQGSWVALTQDPRGRLYASDQYGGLFRVTLPPPGSSAAPSVTAIPLAVGEAQGLVWAFDALYAVVSGDTFESGLYRLRDTDGDDVLDQLSLLRTFDGEGEHGPHGIVVAPDGRSLLIVGGNHTALPGPFERSRLPQTWGEDHLLEPLPDPNGHAVGILAPGGWVVRTDPEGQEWELVAAGFRNPYDLAVDAHGELFTFDSDMEWDAGLPWYRPTRILHVTSGADFGWRTGSSKWPADSYDSLPSAVDIGLASPTGIIFGTGAAFPAPWRDALFACDWAYGKVYAVHLEPRGASFGGSSEVFAEGQPFPVTDVLVGIDGALYLTVGGRRTQSGLYRIRWTGAAPSALSAESAGPEERAREERAALERLHVGEGEPKGALPFVWSKLGSSDRFLRTAARVALEHLDPELWNERLRHERDPRARLEGWLARVHADPTTDAHEVVEQALGIFAAAAEPSERLDALRLLELALIRLNAHDAERMRIREALDGAYPSGDARLDRALLQLLVGVGADVAERALDELERTPDQESRIAILYCLRALEVQGDDARLAHAFERELASAQGGASVHGYLEQMRGVRYGTRFISTGFEGNTLRTVERSHEPGGDEPGSVTHTWTPVELEPRLAELASARDLTRGREAYERASCVQCHRFAGQGRNLGPDLTGASGRYSARDLLRAILEPSREVPDVWRDLELWDEDRLLAVGRIESERDGELRVRTTAGESVQLDPGSVTERREHRLSRMPEGLLDTLDPDEILDLLAYVLSGI